VGVPLYVNSGGGGRDVLVHGDYFWLCGSAGRRCTLSGQRTATKGRGRCLRSFHKFKEPRLPSWWAAMGGDGLLHCGFALLVPVGRWCYSTEPDGPFTCDSGCLPHVREFHYICLMQAWSRQSRDWNLPYINVRCCMSWRWSGVVDMRQNRIGLARTCSDNGESYILRRNFGNSHRVTPRARDINCVSQRAVACCKPYRYVTTLTARCLGL
jgi:hypothetical protein